ncbi:Zinc finger BED domain-containing protein RICESLEEPER 3 [Euphorbia peplus]|nr:Zinc finger BED domain-containing protein RICESLEEPER 3 [Euphorbia peplus]
MRDSVEETLHRLYTHYESKSCGVFSCSQTSDELGVDDVEDDPVLSFQQKYSRHRKGIQNLESNSEVSRYLLESCEEIDGNFDVLKWWKSNATKYPTLSEIAKDVLAIHVSTVASESAFSTGGRILDPFRSSLSPLMVEALVCCQNWLRSTPIPIDLREAMDTVEMYAELESEFAQLCQPSIQD